MVGRRVMQVINLSNVENQTFTIVLDGDLYSIAIYYVPGGMCCDLERNGVEILTGSRIMPNDYIIIFYGYQNTSGNFMLTTQNDDLADYNEFGITQTLIYLSFDEMKQILGIL
jgi:hypothetical protein